MVPAGPRRTAADVSPIRAADPVDHEWALDARRNLDRDNLIPLILRRLTVV